MADVFTQAKRSEVMSRIKGRGNRDTELAFMAILKSQRITGWRRHLAINLSPLRKVPCAEAGRRQGKGLKVHPDFVFPAKRLAVFIDGCFWHGCPKHATQPTSNKVFWQLKLSSNKERDRFVTRRLKKLGWGVLRIWEHELRHPNSVQRRLQRRLISESLLAPASLPGRDQPGVVGSKHA